MAPPRSITLLAINYPPEPTGNAPYSGSLAEGLTHRGNLVDAYVTHPHYPSWSISDGYGEWTRVEDVAGVKVRRMRHYVPSRPRGLRRLLSEFSFGARLLGAPNSRADVMIALSPALFSTWIATWRYRNLPLIVWVQDIYALGLSEIGEGGGVAARVTRHVEGKVMRRANRIVVIHERFAERLIELYGVDPDRIEVMRNYTYVPDGAPVDRVAARQAEGWGDETVVLYTGNFGAKQGLENVIEAARIADERGAPVRFVLMGGGGEEARLRDLAQRPAEGSRHSVTRLKFEGPRPSERFRAALAAADILLVSEKPGVSESSVPSKLATYFDAGRPIIAAGDRDGITAEELALANAGVSVPAAQPQALLDAVLELRSDPTRAQELGENGYRYRKHAHDKEKSLDRWNSLVEEVIVADLTTRHPVAMPESVQF